MMEEASRIELTPLPFINESAPAAERGAACVWVEVETVETESGNDEVEAGGRVRTHVFLEV